MDNLGQIIKRNRENKNLPLRTVASALGIDPAILSKIERGKRKPSKQLVTQFAKYFKLKESDLLVAWLSDKIMYEIEGEELALEAMKLAEERVKYEAFQKVDRSKILRKLKSTIGKFPKIEKAWIYGSFSRQDDGPESDIDVAIKAESDFNYFDLAEIQHHLELSLKRKVDIGFIDSFKSYIFENIQPDLRLIYEK